jgi:hypothetical protein
MSVKWIAQRLEIGGWTNVSNLLGAKRKQECLKSEPQHPRGRLNNCLIICLVLPIKASFIQETLTQSPCQNCF